MPPNRIPDDPVIHPDHMTGVSFPTALAVEAQDACTRAAALLDSASWELEVPGLTEHENPPGGRSCTSGCMRMLGGRS